MNIHANKTSNGSIDVVFHIPTPLGDNSVEVPWCDCVKNCRDYFKYSQTLQTSDHAAIKNGELIEVCETYTFIGPNLSDAQKKLELEERYVVVVAETITELENKLRYYGFEEDV